MIFPLAKFWLYTPWGWCAAVLWNACELLRVPCPAAPFVFGLIMNVRGRRA